ncbi:MAG: hypothetical protein A3H27_14745 [Acidobacteria bacterium RIFCSPLOWO2_02_FULL_59_13]|nr:MAG: hypothetical protein A3H27_14745 [Acidobacteria bacterium RIFCSPLOWO2_02_FULL_59_13]
MGPAGPLSVRDTVSTDSPTPVPAPIISVFGSSRCKKQSQPYRLAQQLGAALGQAGFRVASGGYGGVMEAVSRGASEAGAKVIGVVYDANPAKANRWVQEKILVPNWEERLMQLITLGNGYVACPGGTGTLVELAVAWEMLNKGLLASKPLVALDEFWRPVVEQVQKAEQAGLGSATGEELVYMAGSVPAAVEFLRNNLSPPPAPR